MHAVDFGVLQFLAGNVCWELFVECGGVLSGGSGGRAVTILLADGEDNGKAHRYAVSFCHADQNYGTSCHAESAKVEVKGC